MLKVLQKGYPSSLLMIRVPDSIATLSSKYQAPIKKKRRVKNIKSRPIFFLQPSAAHIYK